MIPALAVAANVASKVGPWVLALGPLISEFFSGSGGDDQAAAKISEARDGLAARLSAAEGMSMEAAKAAIDEHLKPLVEQHAQDAAGKGNGLVNGAMAAVGGVMLGRGMGKAAAKLAGAAKGAVAKGAEAVEDGVLTARAAANQATLKSARSGAMDSVRPSGPVTGPRLGYSAPREVEAEIMDNTPPNMRGMRESIVPTDRFIMRDAGDPRLDYDPQGSLPSPIEETLRRRAMMEKLDAMTRGG